MEIKTAGELIGSNPYPGRGLLLGASEDGRSAVAAYFIMGRSRNSRNRVFTSAEGGIVTEAADPSAMSDPSLIIYSPVRTLGGDTIVTNGDQTDTIYDALALGGSFEGALRTRSFEPDAPNWTPRISGLIRRSGGEALLSLSILKSRDGADDRCERFFWEFGAASAGEGRMIHTYEGDGSPLPSFDGEPRRVRVSGTCESLAREIWDALDSDNRISLFVRYIDIASGETEDVMINKYHKA